MFGDSFWPRQVGRTATKLSCVTQKSFHSTSLPVGAILNVIFLRARITYHQESAGKIPTDRGLGDGQKLYFLPGLTHFVSRKKIYLLLNQSKFEKTDNVFIKSIHSGLWQNFLSLLAQVVVEQEADKLFS